MFVCFFVCAFVDLFVCVIVFVLVFYARVTLFVGVLGCSCPCLSLCLVGRCVVVCVFV